MKTKRETILKGEGKAGSLRIVIGSTSEKDLTRAEHDERHDLLVEKVHHAMSESGCYSQYIKVIE